uniref:Laminin N-terminal domain-containing protein n=1 Tax=Ditylenchus dipsaci TaxID=166011 RepID=A0A915DVE8_9BILA
MDLRYLLLLVKFFLLLLFGNLCESAYFSQFSSLKEPENDPCYDATGRPQRCVPDFINAAFGKPVIASSTCGLKKPERFCMLGESENGLFKEQCEVCDGSSWQQSHPASLLTDLNNSLNNTCWISQPSTEYPHNVTLTLSLGKKFELTYVSLQFCGRLADSLAIYKSTNRGKTWTPFQFFSTDCLKIYGKKPNVEIGRHNEQDNDSLPCLYRLVSTIFSIQLANAFVEREPGVQIPHLITNVKRVAFPLLEGRPSAYEFEKSPVLQDWVTATDIRIVFNRLRPDQSGLYGLAIDDSKSSIESIAWTMK